MSAIKITPGSDLNISDVIDVIEHDPDYSGHPPNPVESSKSLKVSANIKKEASDMLSTTPASAEVSGTSDARHRAVVKIIEQPASKALRFRYECEGRSAGSIPGTNSTPDNKTYPTIQVTGYRGKAVVVVSCVTKDLPYKPHPHSLVGKEGCKKGVCTLEINNENMICSFSNLGIQCVKKKGIEEALKLREEIRVDPFHTGFAHKSAPQTIDLNSVRLCFQVFLEGSQRGKFTVPLKPVVSEPIFDKKAMNDLTICKLSDFTSPVCGGKEIIMLCDKVTKDDVEIYFYHEHEGQSVWEGFGEFTASDVHKQCAISFRTPRYKSIDLDEPVNVYVQLRRPSDKECSEPRPFQFLPLDSDAEMLKRKKQRLFESNSSRLKDFLLDNVFETHETTTNRRVNSPSITVEPPRQDATAAGGSAARPIKHGARTKVKKEPADVVAPETFNYEPVFDGHFSLNPPAVNGLGGVSPSTSPNPPYQNYVYQFPTSPHYNIPVQSPNPFQPVGTVNDLDPVNQSIRASNILDLDDLNIQPQQQQAQPVPEEEINDYRAMNLPLSDCNIDLIESHLLSNLSLHDADTDVQASSAQNESMSTSNVQPELPVLTFSAMMSSADLDGAHGFGREPNS